MARIITQVIIFRTVQKVVRPLLPAFQANVIAYTVVLIGQRIRDRGELDRIWADQTLPPQLVATAAEWARHVDKALHESAAGRMVSECAKKITAAPVA